MSARDVPEVVRNKALAAGAAMWLDELPALVTELERDWSITVGRAYAEGTEAFVAEATLADGTEAVLKLLIPRTDDAVSAARNEITVLPLTNGEGCARLLREDAARNALLLERLGASMHSLSLPLAQRHEILCSTARLVWRPAPDCGLPTGAEKGRWLIDFITTAWQDLDRPCSERAVDYALWCAARRIAAHDDERAVLVHGDVHHLMREDPVELLDGDPHHRARWLAQRTGLDATAIWEWGVVERVSTGLLATRIDLQPAAREMLAVADRVSARRG